MLNGEFKLPNSVTTVQLFAELEEFNETIESAISLDATDIYRRLRQENLVPLEKGLYSPLRPEILIPFDGSHFQKSEGSGELIPITDLSVLDYNKDVYVMVETGKGKNKVLKPRVTLMAGSLSAFKKAGVLTTKPVMDIKMKEFIESCIQILIADFVCYEMDRFDALTHIETVIASAGHQEDDVETWLYEQNWFASLQNLVEEIFYLVPGGRKSSNRLAWSIYKFNVFDRKIGLARLGDVRTYLYILERYGKAMEKEQERWEREGR